MKCSSTAIPHSHYTNQYLIQLIYQPMSTIEVVINSTSTRPTHCIVAITNCDTRYVDTKRVRINAGEATEFIDVQPGRYYIVMVPEGENARHTRFRRIKGTSDHASVTVNLTAIDPVGKITAIVLVGGQRSPGDIVTVQCRENGYYECGMTNINGEAVFHGVPEGYLYSITAYHDSVTQEEFCDLSVNGDGDFETKISFEVCTACKRKIVLNSQ